MAVCKKCGAHIEENIKFCDKCGSEVSFQSEETVADVQETTVKEIITEEVTEAKEEKMPVNVIEQLENSVYSFLPHPFTKKGDRTSLIIGLGAMAILAITYIICFFSFMPEMCLPVGFEISDMGNSASPLWIVIHFIFNLFPVFFVIKAFLDKKYRLYALFVSVIVFVITVFALVLWGMCEPSNYIESVAIYRNSPGSIAWFAFVDCLSEAWYVKILLSLASVFGFGVDYIVNKGK